MAGRGREPGSSGRLPSGNRQKNIKRMHEGHHQMVRLMLLGMGNKEIASRLGVTPQNVSDVRNSPIVRERLALLSSAADAETVDLRAETIRIAGSSVKFLEEVQEGIDRGEGAPLHLRVKVAESFMDRAVPKKVTGEFLHAHLTGEEIEDIKKRAREGGLIVDTTATEVDGDNGGDVEQP